jgi:hypothetical protein
MAEKEEKYRQKGNKLGATLTQQKLRRQGLICYTRPGLEAALHILRAEHDYKH